jgi:tripartite-type tricarboxylate transporter receptor subunit TctC
MLCRLLGACAFIAFCTGGALAPAHATYPERPIRIVVPVSPGGGNDIVARLLAQKLTDRWQEQVVVDNRPGASTAIGAEIVARAIPDGYTLLFHSASFAINAAMQRKLPFDPVRDFMPIGLIARVPQILVVNPGFSAKTVSELLAAAKARPGQINFASSGNGSSPHLAMEVLMEMTGVSLNHVPYKGTAPALADVVAGQVQVTFDAIPPALGYVRGGRVRPLMVVSPKRFPSLPEVPTNAEAGLPGYDFASWFGMLAPARTPGAVITALNREVVAIIQSADIRDRLTDFGLEPLGTSAEENGRHLQAEITRWRAFIERHHIQPH